MDASTNYPGRAHGCAQTPTWTYSTRVATYDGNLNWVQVSVDRPDQIQHVYASLQRGLGRPRLRPPSGNVMAVEFFDQHAEQGRETVETVLQQELGSPSWIKVEVGCGNVHHMFGPHPA